MFLGSSHPIVTPASNEPSGLWPYPTEFPDLLLRTLQEQDAEELFTVTDRNRAHLVRWLPWVDATRTPNDSSMFIRHASEEQASLRAVHCAITLRKEIIGVIAFNAIDHFHRSSTIGYWLAQTHTGNGYMTGAVRALIQLGFKYLNLNRIEVRIAPENPQAHNLMGMVLTEANRPHTFTRGFGRGRRSCSRLSALFRGRQQGARRQPIRQNL